MVAMVPAFAGHLHPGYRGGPYVLGGAVNTWLLAALTVGVGGVMMMATMLGDWTRYIPARRYPPARLLPVALAAIAVSYIVPMAIGALVTTAFRNPYAPFPQSLVASAPGWYAAVLVPMALLGGLVFTGSNLYSTGLDLSAIAARLTRARATTIMSVLCLGLVLAGTLAWRPSASLTAVTLLLLAVTGPWAAVIGVGYLRCRGAYLEDALQVFNQRRRGGAYWFARGWHPAAVAAWAAGAVFGLLSVQTTLYSGPLAGIAGGVDVSFAGSFLLAAAVYLLAEKVSARASWRAVLPIRDGGRAAVPAAAWGPAPARPGGRRT
jgi:purine-cytosine permease-like protein